MRYTTFERLVLVFGGGAILATLVVSTSAHQDLAEFLAQLILIGVLVGAVHWGRRGGLVAAVAACLLYFVLRLPLLVRTGGLTPDMMVLLVTRFATYGVIGIFGGELCQRIKYLFARLEDDSRIDDWTRVYNQNHAVRLIDNVIGRNARYGTPFSLVLIHLAPALTEGLRPPKQHALLKAAAGHIRGDVRLVDDVARLDDSRFLVILPSTPREGALVAAERVRVGVRDVLGAKDESVTASVLGADTDAYEIERLRASLAPGAAPQASSGE